MTLVLMTVFGCSPEQSIRRQKEEVVPPAEPPEYEFDVYGNPPNWNDCFEGFRGLYYNLPNSHPDIEPDVDEPAPADHTTLDWWDYGRLYADQFDASIDFGTNWWPVDDGLADDPSYFSVRWVAWIRVWDDGPFRFSLGAADDAWVIFDDDQVLAAQPGINEYDPQEYEVNLDAGQAHFDVRYAHRAGGANGFRFRVLEGNATICYPDFDDE